MNRLTDFIVIKTARIFVFLVVLFGFGFFFRYRFAASRALGAVSHFHSHSAQLKNKSPVFLSDDGLESKLPVFVRLRQTGVEKSEIRFSRFLAALFFFLFLPFRWNSEKSESVNIEFTLHTNRWNLESLHTYQVKSVKLTSSPLFQLFLNKKHLT